MYERTRTEKEAASSEKDERSQLIMRVIIILPRKEGANVGAMISLAAFIYFIYAFLLRISASWVIITSNYFSFIFYFSSAANFLYFCTSSSYFLWFWLNFSYYFFISFSCFSTYSWSFFFIWSTCFWWCFFISSKALMEKICCLWKSFFCSSFTYFSLSFIS